ncbi:MFS transporter [Actinomadura terrae]|uniref:MFS transporter n=1 Tax=Actinomadura terrae TaxID=604353 RepID=UPI001FA6AC18|nr:MFS transporter [Actinomadura terrae]
MTGSGSTATAGGPPAEAAQARARHDFRLLWAGQSVSLVGDRVMVVALPLLAVSTLGASAAQAALLPFAHYASWLLLALPAGAVVDRLPRRTTAIVCDCVQAVVFAVVAGLIWLDALAFPVLLGLVFVSGSAVVFFQVAYTSYLPRLVVDRADLARGNARLFLSESLARTAGPMLAGPLIGLLGAAVAVALNCGSLVVSVLTLLGIRHRERPAAARDRGRGWLRRDVRHGLSFVARHPLLEPVFLCGSVYVLFLSVVETVLVLYCRDVLRLEPGAIGLVVGSAALGLPLGNLASRRASDRLGLPRTLVLGAAVSATGLALMPMAGALGSAVGLVAGSIVHGAGEGLFNPAALTLRQIVTPDALLGRVNAVQRFAIWGALPLGSLLAAAITALSGLPAALWVGGTGTVLCLVPLLRRGIMRALRDPAHPAHLVAPASPQPTRRISMEYAPGIAGYIDRFNRVMPPDFYQRPVEEQRRLYEGLTDEFPYDLPPGITITDEDLDAEDGRRLRVRVYRPHAPSGRGAVCFIRGGGFVLGSLSTHHVVIAELAAKTGLTAFALDYRVAPEDPFPAGLEDCYASVCALAASAARRELDPDRIVVAGDSSGANMAVAISMMCRDRRGPDLAGQALINPVLDLTRWRHGGEDVPLLSGGEMEFFTRCYCPTPGDEAHPYVSPLVGGKFHDLPPAYIMGAELDSLSVDGERYAAALRAQGVPVEQVSEPGIVHAALRARAMSPNVAAAWDRFCAATARLAERSGAPHAAS